MKELETNVSLRVKEKLLKLTIRDNSTNYNNWRAQNENNLNDFLESPDYKHEKSCKILQ